MTKDEDRLARIERAERLVAARKRAGYRGPKHVHDELGFNLNNYKAHEQGRNGFGLTDAKVYAKAFNVSLPWLNFRIGSIDDPYVDLSAEKQELLDLYDGLPPELQQAQLATMRGLAAGARPQEPEKSGPGIDAPKGG